MRPFAELWPARTAQKPAPHSSLHSRSSGPLLCEDGHTASSAPARSSTAVALPRRPDRPAPVLGATAPNHTPHWRALHDDRPGFPIGTAPRVRRCSTHGLQRQNLQRPGISSQEKESVVPALELDCTLCSFFCPSFFHALAIQPGALARRPQLPSIPPTSPSLYREVC